MSLLPPERVILLIELLFVFYALASFVWVTGYAAARVRTGTMIDGPASPPRFAVRAHSGWPYAICVLALFFLQSGLSIILIVAGMAGLLLEAGRSASEQFGLTRLRPGLLLKWSLLLCGAVIFVEIPLGWQVDRIMTALNLPHPEQESVEAFRRMDHVREIAAFLLQAVVLMPMIEELFFRGFLYSFLKNYTSTGLALVLSAGVFAFAHANLGAALQLWVLGLVLGLAYEHFGSLLLPFGIHACWNLFTAVSLLLQRGGG